MRVQKIPAHEARFDANGTDSLGKVFNLSKNSIDIPGEAGQMEYVKVDPVSGDKSFYYEERIDKDQIVLHYTLGYLKGDMATLTKPNYHVSVPFIIGRNGTIYNLFSSGYWSYHLGRGALGGNKIRSSRTIGVEISNIGGLKRVGGEMHTYYANDVYCDASQQEFYVAQPYRRFDYYATYTEAQYRSLIILLRYLTARYNIGRKFLDEAVRYDSHDRAVSFGGIVSHVNYRSEGKEDIGPAFDWQRVISGLNAG